MEDEIAEIANRTLLLYKLGPLHKFNVDSIDVIIASLKAHICNRLELKGNDKGKKDKYKVYKGHLVDLRVESLYFKDLPSYHPDVQPLKFTVEIIDYEVNRQVKHHMFMIPATEKPNSVLLNNTNDSTLPNSGVDDLAIYPLIMMKGSPKVRNTIREWFEKAFFAYCQRMYVPPHKMIEFVDLWIESLLGLTSEDDEEGFFGLPRHMASVPLKLEFKTGNEWLSDIDVTLTPEEALAVCKEVNKQYFWDSFEKHVYTTTGVRSSTLKFDRASNALGGLRSDGTMKINGYAYKVYAVKFVNNMLDLAVSSVFQD